MKDRIHDIMTHLGLSQQEFAAQLDLSSSSISNIFNGRTNPTITHVMAIHRAFPQVNDKWLLYGEGAMFVDEEEAPSPISDIMIMDDEDDDAALGDLFEKPETTSPTLAPRGSGKLSSTVASRSRQRSNNVSEERPKKGVQEPVEEEFETVKNFDKIIRRVKEIRVFYDDNTYETFVPAVK